MVHSETDEGNLKNFSFFCCRSKEAERRPIQRISRQMGGASGSNSQRNTPPAHSMAANQISDARPKNLEPLVRPKKKELGLSVEELSWAVESPSKKSLVQPETLHTLNEEEHPEFVISVTSEDLNHVTQNAHLLGKKTSLAAIGDEDPERKFNFLQDSSNYNHLIDPSESDSLNPRRTNKDRLDSDFSDINQPMDIKLAEAEFDIDTRLDHAMEIRGSQEFKLRAS